MRRSIYIYIYIYINKPQIISIQFSLYPPTPLSPFPAPTLVALIRNCHVTPYVMWLIYIPLLIEKDLCDGRNVSVKFIVPVIRISIHFFGKCPFFIPSFVLSVHRTLPFHVACILQDIFVIHLAIRNANYFFNWTLKHSILLNIMFLHRWEDFS